MGLTKTSGVKDQVSGVRPTGDSTRGLDKYYLE